MKITLTDGNNFINLDVDNDQLIEDVKALLEVQIGTPLNQIELFYEGQTLSNNQKLSSRQIGQGALLYYANAKLTQPKPKPKTLGIANMIKNFEKQRKMINQEGYEFDNRKVEQFKKQAERLISEIKNDHYRLSQIAQAHPEISAAIEKGDAEQLAKLMHKNRQDKIKEIKEKEKRFIELSKDPMNPEYQRLLEQRINQQNIDKNFEFANEYIPQVFGHITMLYIKATINKVAINAFVDSGAQSTIMSQSLAERCGLMRLVDVRQAGKAVGVGSCKILGKIHAAQIEIEGKYLTCSFTVIQNNSVEFLLGLDMLRRFNCVIDLSKNNLMFQNGMITTHFLSDAEVEKAKKVPITNEELEVKIKKLIEMGFSKNQALQALKVSGFNEQVAGNILMQKKYGNK